MYHKQLVRHIVSSLEKGMMLENIKIDLKEDGWSELDIKEAVNYAMYPEKLNHFSFYRFLDSEVPVYLAILLIVFSIASFFLIFLGFKNEVKNYSVYLTSSVGSPKIEFKYGEQLALANPVFFEKVKNQFVSDKVNFIEVDLSKMKVRLYKEGVVLKEFPVLTKGRPGSWWETPAGLYKINKKDKLHFSGMGHVYMPWSLAFQGNFYIHGWPYYPDGKPVASTYSGGCVRLADESAKEIFDFAEVGTPILLHEEDFKSDNFTYESKKPILSAKHYLVADLLNNFVLLKSDGDSAPVASITKLMTALVATEYINLDNEATVPKEAIVFTSKPRLVEGEKVSIYQLLFPLLLESSNEAAETIARFYGRSNFIEKMNEKAISIGMTSTKFEDASGALSGNVSTVDDLFMLAKYIYNNRSFIFNLSSGKLKVSAYGESYFKNLSNLNDFSEDKNFFGGKVGKTTVAMETGLFVFKLNIKGEERPIVVIVLGSENRKLDTENILNYIKSNY
jgi:hypothetical protein